MDTSIPSSQQRPTQQPAAPDEPRSQLVSQPAVSDTKQVSDADDTKQQVPANYAPNKEFAQVASVSPSEMGAQEPEDDDEDEDKVKVARQEVMISTKVAPVQEVPLSQELKELGVEQGADTPKEVPVVVQRAGMRVNHVDAAIPVSASGAVKIPITYEHAAQLDKRSKIKESIKWLARFIMRQWEKVRYMEKQKGEEV